MEESQRVHAFILTAIGKTLSGIGFAKFDPITLRIIPNRLGIFLFAMKPKDVGGCNLSGCDDMTYINPDMEPPHPHSNEGWLLRHNN